MAKAKYQTKKTHVNIGTIGHIDYGKTTLIDAITNAQANKFGTEVKSHDQIENLNPIIYVEVEGNTIFPCLSEESRGKEQAVAKDYVNSVGANLFDQVVVSSEDIVSEAEIISETCSKKEQEEDELE